MLWGKWEERNLALREEIFLLYSKATRAQIQRSSGQFSTLQPGQELAAPICEQTGTPSSAVWPCHSRVTVSQSRVRTCQTHLHLVPPPQRHTGLDGKQGVPLMKLQHIKNYYSFVFSGFRQCNVIYSKKC